MNESLKEKARQAALDEIKKEQTESLKEKYKQKIKELTKARELVSRLEAELDAME